MESESIFGFPHIPSSQLPKFQALVGATVGDLINLRRLYDIDNLRNLSTTTQTTRHINT